MALLWIEGFEGYGSGSNQTAYVARRYQNLSIGSPNLATTTGRVAGYAMGASSTVVIRTFPLTTCDTLIVGCGLKFTSTAGVITFLQLMDGTTAGVNLRYNVTAKTIDVYRGSPLLGSTTGVNINANTWYYVEAKVKCHASAGTVDVHVDGVSRLSLSSQNTQAGSHAYHDRVGLCVGYSSGYYYLDDIYVCDATGTINNGFLGVRRVVALYPSGDSATVQWTPSGAGTHASLVNEAQDSESGYVESATVGQADVWDYQDIANVGTIYGIQVNTTCRESDARSFSLITRVVSGATTSDDSARPIGTASLWVKSRVVETDPNTGSYWGVGGLSAAQFGVVLA